MAAAIRDGHASGVRPEIGDQFLHRGEDTLLSRAAWIDGQGVAVKSVTVLPGNAARGLPSVHGVLVLFEDVTGQVVATIDSALVTKWKTAADSLAGAQLLARPGAKRMLIVGAGAVAEALVAAFREGFPGIDISIWNRTTAKARALAQTHGLTVAEDLAAAAGQADIISCATMSETPVLKGAWLQPGVHVDLIGAFKPSMREADDAVLQRGRLFVDSFATTLDHIGELMIPLKSGAIQRSDVLGDLYDLCTGQPGRRSDADITVFKNGGGAHLDLLTAQVILKAWRNRTHGAS